MTLEVMNLNVQSVAHSKFQEMMKYIGKRKHHSQLTYDEKQALLRRLQDITRNDGWKISRHALNRLQQKRVRATYNDLVNAVYNCWIVEYKINWSDYAMCDERVVVRSKKIVNDKYNLKIVYSLTTKCIVTVWLNHVKDFHRTLDWSIYDPDMKVFV